ncbi:MAG: hypothetical protein HND42_07080 [Armatimonadetes bacterium]|nr:hypothetical protein [Armatimonadota bacterium]
MFLSVSLAAASAAGGFGQFAFTHVHNLHTMEVGPTYFRPFAEGGVAIRFGTETKDVSFQGVSRYFKAISMRPAPGSPIRLAYEATGLGFSVECRDGLTLTGSGVGPPTLTWADASVRPGLPTPDVKWVVLTWPDKRPPIFVGFATRPCGLIAERTDGGFRVKTTKPYVGWARIRTPYGNDSLRVNGAAALGQVAQQVSSIAERLLRPAPKVQSVETVVDSNGITATWTFDSEFAVIPEVAFRASSSGLLKVASPYKRATLGGGTGLRMSLEKKLTLRFLCRPLYPGLALVWNGEDPFRPGTVAYADAESVCDAALSVLLGQADDLTIRALTDAHDEFLSDAPRTQEPVTKLTLFCARDGSGASLAASHAVGSMAREGSDGELAGLLASIDWVSWLPIGKDDAERKQTAAILAIAGAISGDEQSRLLAAMANAAGAADVLGELRSWVYPRLATLQAKPPEWWASIASPVRLLSPDATFVPLADGAELSGLSPFGKESVVRLVLPDGATVSPISNIASVERVAAEGDVRIATWKVSPVEAGMWKLRIRLAPGGAVPKAARGPRYSEGRRSPSGLLLIAR